MPQETLQRGKAAAEQAERKFGQGVSTAADNVREFNITVIEMAQANIDAAFEFARRAATARTPGDIVELWNTHIPNQFQLLTEQTRVMTELGQKFASLSTLSIVPVR